MDPFTGPYLRYGPPFTGPYPRYGPPFTGPYLRYGPLKSMLSVSKDLKITGP